VRISVLAENISRWGDGAAAGSEVFLDMNPGMDRRASSKVTATRLLNYVAQSATWGWSSAACIYDGQYGSLEQRERTAVAHAGYERLLKVVSEIERSGTGVPEVITAERRRSMLAASRGGFRREGSSIAFRRTVVYCDATSLAQLPTSTATSRQCWS